MTGAAPVLDRPALWAALSHIRIEMPVDSVRFEAALAAGQSWTLEFAERVADEYRRFLYLAATAGFEVTPSRAVDEAWHLHIATPHYEERLCAGILGRPLEHRPATGEPGEEERHHRQYDETLDLYEAVFGQPPPLDIWPDARPRAERKGPRPHPAVVVTSWTAAAAALASAAALSVGYPATALVLGSVALLLTLYPLLLISMKAQWSGGAGCGGSSGSSQGCAGCGAGSCGGGGCGGD